MNRAAMYRRLRQHQGPWDMIVVGGGATGAGVAIDAASRGYSVLLLEQSDFGKGTSSRSTKLVHGGVRYLEQGNLSLVMEALKERGLLLQNAPHLVRNLAFVVPTYDWWEVAVLRRGAETLQPAGRQIRLRIVAHSLARRDARTPAHHQDRRPARRCGVLRRPVRRCPPAHQPGRHRVRARRRAAELRARHHADQRRGRLRGWRGLPRRRNRRGLHRAGAGRGERHRPVHRRSAAHGRPLRAAHDRAQPRHPPGVRPFVPGRRQCHHGAPHQRRAGAFRHSLARPHPGRHHRYPHLFDTPGARRARARDRLHSRNRVAVPFAHAPRDPTC